MDDQY
jgi:cilia- and flagella-associated protein 251